MQIKKLIYILSLFFVIQSYLGAMESFRGEPVLPEFLYKIFPESDFNKDEKILIFSERDLQTGWIAFATDKQLSGMKKKKGVAYITVKIATKNFPKSLFTAFPTNFAFSDITIDMGNFFCICLKQEVLVILKSDCEIVSADELEELLKYNAMVAKDVLNEN